MDKALISLAEETAEKLKAAGVRLVIAESCTAGLTSQAMGATSGSADFFSCGVVSYTEDAKQRVLGVKAESLAQYTAVSQQVVSEMAEGIKALAQEAVGLAISGYAGPNDAEDGTPAGTIWFAWSLPNGGVVSERMLFKDEPERVIVQAASHALRRLGELLV